MGFMDELKRLARPYEDEEDDYDDFDDAPAPRNDRSDRFDRSDRSDRRERRDSSRDTGAYYPPVEERRSSNKVVNIHTTTQLQVVLVKPERFENASEIADHLREKLSALAAQAVGSPHVRLRGLMAIPPVAAGPDGNRPFFAKMRQLYVDIRSQMDDNKTSFDCLSMGMSGDFEDAVREGATLVRVGTALFGPRPPMHKG